MRAVLKNDRLTVGYPHEAPMHVGGWVGMLRAYIPIPP